MRYFAAAVCLCVFLLGNYVAGYFCFGFYIDNRNWEDDKPYAFRYYRSELVARIYRPAAKLESWWVDGLVETVEPTRIEYPGVTGYDANIKVLDEFERSRKRDRLSDLIHPDQAANRLGQ